MENLLRGLLELPSQPAVVLVQALEFNSALMANGGDVHLPVALYYGELRDYRGFKRILIVRLSTDVPVIRLVQRVARRRYLTISHLVLSVCETH